MKRTDLFRLALLVALFGVCYSFSEVFFFTYKTFNILSIVLFLIVIIHIARMLRDEKPEANLSEFIMLFALFMAGVTIKYREKIYFFLFIIYLISFVKNFKLEKPLFQWVVSVFLFVVPLLAFIFVHVKFSRPLYYIIIFLPMLAYEIYQVRDLFPDLRTINFRRRG